MFYARVGEFRKKDGIQSIRGIKSKKHNKCPKAQVFKVML